MLKRLKLEKELKLQRSALSQLEEQETGFQTREQALTVALEEAQTEEDMQTVNENIKQLEQDVAEAGIEEKKGTIHAEIERIENELAELDERAEVKEFYDKVRNLRAVTGAELTIPDIVVNRIMDIVGDYATVYPLVDHVTASGTTRILIDTDTTPATWTEACGTIPEGNVGTITNVDFDGFKVGKIVFVDNCLLEDSIINLDEYVTKKIARSLAMALDKAILLGEGASAKQPDDIIPKLNASNPKTVEADANMLKNLVKGVGLVDTGEDAVGEIVAVMKRSTYYNRIMEYTIHTDANGNVVGKLPNLNKPDLLGIRVEFNNFMPEDAVLFGDFEKYTLVERNDISIDNSIHAKFAADQTAFRGKGRFDGKPTNADAFALVTITEPAA